MIMADNKRAARVPALDRGLDVLESMIALDAPLTLTAIARECGRSVPELQRIVACLHRRGYLLRDVAGAYRIGSRIFTMGQACPPFQDLLAHARLPLRQFARHTGQSVHLSVLSEDQLLILANVSGAGYLQLDVAVGSMHDPVISASGRALLAAMDSEKLRSFLRRSRGSIRQVAQLQSRLARIRLRGYELVQSHLYHGVHDLAVCASAPNSGITAAVACSYLRPRQRIRSRPTPAPAGLLRQLLDCAAEISTAADPKVDALEKIQ